MVTEDFVETTGPMEFGLFQEDPLLNHWNLMFWGKPTGWQIREFLSKGKELDFAYEATWLDEKGLPKGAVFETKTDAGVFLVNEFVERVRPTHPEHIWRRLCAEISRAAYHASRAHRADYGSW